MFRVIKVASHLGAPTKGTDKGPDAIIDFLKLKKVISIKIPHENQEHKEGIYQKVKNLPEVKEICNRLINEAKKVIKNGDIPLVLHGDDSSVIGTVYGMYQSLEEPFGVIYLDAHGDINTPKTTISGYLYGQGLAHLIGLGHPELLRLNKNRAAISYKNLVMIGQRNLDHGEIDLIKTMKITFFNPEQIHSDIVLVLGNIKDKFAKNGVNKIYLHIDQDVVDPLLSGASLCQEPNGITDEELFSIIKFVKQNFSICAVSLGNYLPSIDKNKKTLTIIKETLALILD